MARGVSCCDGDGDSPSCGGGGGGGGRKSKSVCVKRLSSSYGSLVAASSLGEIRNISSDNDTKNNMFYGMCDIDDMSDILYKEDLLECYRRERAMKSFRNAQKRSPSLVRCFEFLKLLCCRT